MSIFTHCEKGHDLQVEDAYIFQPGGARACRQCILDRKGKRPKVPEDAAVGAFNG